MRRAPLGSPARGTSQIPDALPPDSRRPPTCVGGTPTGLTSAPVRRLPNRVSLTAATVRCLPDTPLGYETRHHPPSKRLPEGRRLSPPTWGSTGPVGPSLVLVSVISSPCPSQLCRQSQLWVRVIHTFLLLFVPLMIPCPRPDMF